MKFAVGYPVAQDEDRPFRETVAEFRDAIGEVYFAWPGEPSGRAPAGRGNGRIDWDAQERLEQDLAAFRDMGLRLDLLLNANCYGGRASSGALANTVCSIVDRLRQVAGVDAVTTTSPLVARVIGDRYPGVHVRASVNMRLGTEAALVSVANWFDGFYLQRDFNRDLDRVRELLAWCEARGKRLYLLANSGCLRFCGTQTFHDNLVAHESEVADMQNLPLETLACRQLLREPEHRAALLQATWIRPEDIARYEPWFPLVKLATRLHANPGLVIRAYARRRYDGNLLDLLEPGHRDAFRDAALDNARFPADWFDRTTTCGGRCRTCAYCAETLARISEKA